jgi:hypothetical protein
LFSHQRGKNKKISKNKKQANKGTNKKYPRFKCNTVSVSLSASSPSSVLSSKEDKKRSLEIAL